MEFEIKPQRQFSLGLKELWEYRELFYFFTWRDVKVKYKQTALGFLWAIFQPLVMTLLFTLSIGKLIHGNVPLPLPYPVFVLSGFLLWNIFSGGLSNAGNSMVSNSGIIKKIYFPRLIVPASSILVSLVDFFMAFLVFVPVLYYYGCSFKITALFLVPLSLLLSVTATFGLGTFLAALNVKYRDFRYVLPFFIQALLFATPVIYPVKVSGNTWFQYLLQLNPMNAPIELFRSSVSGEAISLYSVVSSTAVSLLLFVIGIIYFRKTEGYFADLA